MMLCFSFVVDIGNTLRSIRLTQDFDGGDDDDLDLQDLSFDVNNK